MDSLNSNDLDPATIKLAFGSIITARRISMGLNRETFASIARLGGSHLCRIERGDMAPSIITICRIAYAFGCSPGDLMDETEEYIRHLDD